MMYNDMTDVMYALNKTKKIVNETLNGTMNFEVDFEEDSPTITITFTSTMINYKASLSVTKLSEMIDPSDPTSIAPDLAKTIIIEIILCANRKTLIQILEDLL